jgi:hypothetical protein
MQYVDDTILLIEDNYEQARNLKIILCHFEQMSRLKINFHRSDIYCLGHAQVNATAFEEIFTCKVGSLPMKYLGVPIDKKRIKLSDWKPTVEKMGNKLCQWQGKMLVMGGRVILINSSLSSVPLDTSQTYL